MISSGRKNPTSGTGANAGTAERGAPPGMQRWKLTLAYDGAPWRGWQSMPHGQTVQDQIEAALLKIVGIPMRLHASGRTDAGVHALGQVAHGDAPASMRITPQGWVRALNSSLPPSIRLLKIERAAPGFHARFDATGKTYRYRIWHGDVLPPFEAGRAWLVHGRLDLEALHDCARLLHGTHNFARLSANRGDMSEEERRLDPQGTTRTMHRVLIQPGEQALEIEVEGDGFLYKMVRLITGSMIHVARGKAGIAWFAGLLADPQGTKSHHMAPPDGLCLMRVRYPG